MDPDEPIGKASASETQEVSPKGVEDQNTSYKCQICLDLMQEAFLVHCGHSFCFSCIQEHLNHSQSCPVCQTEASESQIYPNFHLNSLIEQHRKRLHQSRNFDDPDAPLPQTALTRKNAVLPQKRAELQNLADQISCLERDKLLVERLKEDDRQILHTLDHTQTIETGAGPIATVPESSSTDLDNLKSLTTPSRSNRKRIYSSIDEPESQKSNTRHKRLTDSSTTLFEKIHQFKKDLEKDYFSMRISGAGNVYDETCIPDSLERFCEDVVSCAKISRFETIAILQNTDHLRNANSSIVSAIDFDKDGEFVTSAGVTRKIKVYRYEDVILPPATISGFITPSSSSSISISSDNAPLSLDASLIPKYPLYEIPCTSKISCLSYNSYLKGTLSASDYMGVVSLYDMNNVKQLFSFEEHEKRCWSVDFSCVDPMRLASGSDDAKVKLWALNQRNSLLTLESKANVCSVKFHPTKSQYIAFGSADHHIHYYDLRFPRVPLALFKGHAKSVSYVRFRSPDELVSASTDSTLRLWDLRDLEKHQQDTSSRVIRTFSGHGNEKNFVGLSVNSTGEFIVCGSETNEIFTYHSKVSKPLFSQKFGNAINALSGEETTMEDTGQFVSSVCWKRNSPNILAASNSRGQIKLLRMI